MRDRALGQLILVLVALMGASAAGSFVACEEAQATRAALEERPPGVQQVEILGVGPGYPAVVEYTVPAAVGDAGVTEPVLVSSADVGGIAVVSISCTNTTTTPCYWGHNAVDAGVGEDHCTSGCTTAAAMGGNYKEIYLDCESEVVVPCKFMLSQRYTE